MKFSLIVNKESIFTGTIGEHFEEIIDFLKEQKVDTSDRTSIQIDLKSTLELRQKYLPFVMKKIDESYIDRSSELERAGYDEFIINNVSYKLFAKSDERKKLLHFFMFYEALNKPDINSFEIKTRNEIKGVDFGSID